MLDPRCRSTHTERSVFLLTEPSKYKAVDLPEGGMSYNPAYEEHQALLAKALKVAEAKQAVLKRRMNFVRPVSSDKKLERELSEGELWSPARGCDLDGREISLFFFYTRTHKAWRSLRG